MIWQNTSTRRLEAKRREKENNSETQPSSTFHKGNILTNSTVLPDKISGKI
jgi:hypothetical protein